jgi:hypothetical protein
MDIEVGSHVVYNGKEYKVLWIYSNGYAEIAKLGYLRKVELVKQSELKKSHKKNTTSAKT